MGNFTASEILTVIVVILIVFGPNRLPELARKAGSLAASARRAMDSLKGEISAEYGDVIAPLRDARDELKSAGSDLKGQVAEIGKEVSAAGNEIKDVTKQALDPPVADADVAEPAATAPGEPSAAEQVDPDPAPNLETALEAPPEVPEVGND